MKSTYLLDLLPFFQLVFTESASSFSKSNFLQVARNILVFEIFDAKKVIIMTYWHLLITSKKIYQVMD